MKREISTQNLITHKKRNIARKLLLLPSHCRSQIHIISAGKFVTPWAQFVFTCFSVPLSLFGMTYYCNSLSSFAVCILYAYVLYAWNTKIELLNVHYTTRSHCAGYCVPQCNMLSLHSKCDECTTNNINYDFELFFLTLDNIIYYTDSDGMLRAEHST